MKKEDCSVTTKNTIKSKEEKQMFSIKICCKQYT